MAATNGSIYRSLIDDELIEKEKSVSFEPSDILITIFSDHKEYVKWLRRKNAVVNFKVTNTDINILVVIYDVRLVWEMENVVEIKVRLKGI